MTRLIQHTTIVFSIVLFSSLASAQTYGSLRHYYPGMNRGPVQKPFSNIEIGSNRPIAIHNRFGVTQWYSYHGSVPGSRYFISDRGGSAYGLPLGAPYLYGR